MSKVSLQAVAKELRNKSLHFAVKKSTNKTKSGCGEETYKKELGTHKETLELGTHKESLALEDLLL